MILNSIDCGDSHPWLMPVAGQSIGELLIEALETVVWPRGAIAKKQAVTFKAKAWQSLGGAGALSQTATLYLLKQLEELAFNRDLQPVYIQWNATAMPGAALNASELHDGWYLIDSLEPDYANYTVTGIVDVRLTVTAVAPAPPRRVALAYSGGALASNFSAAAINLLSLPIGSTAAEAIFTRIGAEGAIPCISAPLASSEPLVLSTTIANTFKGGVHVYDTINTGANPVPLSGSTFVNANWVEVFDTAHDFAGDCVVTNGLQLLLLQAAQAQLATCYLWNTALAVANWQQYATLHTFDVGATTRTLRSYSLIRVGAEETAIACVLSTTDGAAVVLRLQRGRYEVRADFRPLTNAATNPSTLLLRVPAAAKVNYNSTFLKDAGLDGSSGVATDYGYGAGFINSGTYPFVVGLLYQNQPGSNMPAQVSATDFGLGDTTSLAVNAQRSYGFFAIPYGVSGSYSTANLQAEGESGALGTGWSSVADAAGSGGNTAKAASGTVATNADLFGTSFVPYPGTYDVWFRVRVTTNVGSALEMTLGLWDTTSSVFVPSGSTTFNRTAMGTTYAWVRAATGVTPTNAHNMQFRAVTALTLGTDWFIDEAVLAPKALQSDTRGPQDLAQQFPYDRSVRLVRP